MTTKHNLLFLLLLAALCACRKDGQIHEPETDPVGESEATTIRGFYLLNEGNMGMNKASLDYYDYDSAVYHRNIYASANPAVPMELGDVGNDIAIYGSKMYAVINASNKIEVMDAQTAKRIGQIEIPNCRYIRFHEGFAYATSYAGPVQVNPNYEQRGFVAKIDTASLQVIAQCLVGFQPDELEIVGNKIYVANSGGYLTPNYENTVSVIDMASFTETKRIEVAVNLHHLRADGHGNLWVSSRGDYFGNRSGLYRINIADDAVDSLDIAVSNFHLDGDSLYICSVQWSNVTMSNTITYGIVDVAKKQILTRNFITDGTDAQIQTPYGINVNPITKDIFVTDAKNYVSPGALYCFAPDGRQKWNVRTGDIPAHLVFLFQ